MPNHITSRVTIVGTKEQVQSIVEAFGTNFERRPKRAYDESIICADSNGDFCGWYNEQENTFTYSNDRDSKIKGKPEGVQYEYIEAFTQFPDFEKVFPVPECLKDLEPHSGIVTAVKAKYQIPISGNPLLASLELQNRISAKTSFEGKEKEIFERCCKAYEETGFVYWYDWNIEHWGTKWNSYSCEKEAENVFIFDTAWRGVPGIVEEMSKRFPDVTFNYEYADEDTGSNCASMVIKNGNIEELNQPESGSNEAYELAFKLRPHKQKYYHLVDGKYEYNDDAE